MIRRAFSDLPSFETLKAMAEEKPEELKALRQALTREVVETAPSEERRRRLEGLNFTIEMNRRKASNPMHSCLLISQLMWDSALTMVEELKKDA